MTRLCRVIESPVTCGFRMFLFTLFAGDGVTVLHFRGRHVEPVLWRRGVDCVRVNRGCRGSRVSASGGSLHRSVSEAARALDPDRALQLQFQFLALRALAFGLNRSLGTSAHCTRYCALCRSSSPTSCSSPLWASLSYSTSSTPPPAGSPCSPGPSTSPGFEFAVHLSFPLLIALFSASQPTVMLRVLTCMRSRQLY